MKNEVTKIINLGKAEAEPLEQAKFKMEENELRMRGEEAMLEVRQSLERNINNMSEKNREICKALFLNNPLK